MISCSCKDSGFEIVSFIVNKNLLNKILIEIYDLILAINHPKDPLVQLVNGMIFLGLNFYYIIKTTGFY